MATPRVLQPLIELAERDEPEDWEVIEEELQFPQYHTPEVITWAAYDGLEENVSDNLRHLAARILEHTAKLVELGFDQKSRVHQRMLEDRYHIVRFRLAFALNNRGDNSADVVRFMLEAMKDPDVGELAIDYFYAANNNRPN